ncbi:hypothetical protein [Paenibacillus macquariensis]|uniref:hypothetical protein n=1 Tax=Paenibacillus macquariensis TaxID=948756 RepID=UPI002DB8A144|nr:hypothetical protein [Paenibacillus macquariensis]MEC0092536.1 hypothetical protein [Paenibacillus macquariensis]
MTKLSWRSDNVRLCPLISTAIAVYNQEIRGQQRSEGQFVIVAVILYECFSGKDYSNKPKKLLGGTLSWNNYVIMTQQY